MNYKKMWLFKRSVYFQEMWGAFHYLYENKNKNKRVAYLLFFVQPPYV